LGRSTSDPARGERPRRVLILGAAGRDFHDFNLVFRDNPRFVVVAFTAAQVPNIEGRVYPPSLAGPLYREGVPILAEAGWERLIGELAVDEVVFAYSDVSHEEVMHHASRAVAAGADFRLLGAASTMLRSRRPVVSVCAVRTGAGKSPVSRHLARLLRERGLRVAVIRHPMPYGDLARQAVQRFTSLADVDRAGCTIEEREEYEPHLAAGDLVYAGVDYGAILERAEAEADAIVWDGGNNDLPFIEPDLEVVLVDPHRPGHERTYFPGEANLLRADVVVMAKVDTADPRHTEAVAANVRQANPAATLVRSTLALKVEEGERLRGARVLVIEDGPTLTHGGMSYGAGALAARSRDAVLVDPRPYAVGSIAEAFAAYPHLGPVLPALGYGEEQTMELAETVRRVPCDLVLVAAPVDLRRLLAIDKPTLRVSYEYADLGHPTLAEALAPFLDNLPRRP
jgi:predicted GTPase